MVFTKHQILNIILSVSGNLTLPYLTYLMILFLPHRVFIMIPIVLVHVIIIRPHIIHII